MSGFATLVKTYAVSDGECMKIGKTGNVRSRLSQLQSSNPHELVLIALYDGDIETRAHIAVGKVTIVLNGEWFLDTPEARAVLFRLGFSDLMRGEKLEREIALEVRREFTSETDPSLDVEEHW